VQVSILANWVTLSLQKPATFYSQFALQNLIHRPPLFNIVDLKEIEVFIDLRVFAAGPQNTQKNST
jgi:hypothetical protein